jgi:putative flippase GtrA
VNSEFRRFVVVGGLAAAANVGSRMLFGLWLDYLPSILLAFLVGLSTAFLLNRSWVFARSGKHWSNEAMWFTAVNLFGLLQTMVISLLLARYLLPALGQQVGVDTTAHVVGVAVPIITSYLGHKYLSFGKH